MQAESKAALVAELETQRDVLITQLKYLAHVARKCYEATKGAKEWGDFLEHSDEPFTHRDWLKAASQPTQIKP